jgi:hypothetical protein
MKASWQLTPTAHLFFLLWFGVIDLDSDIGEELLIVLGHEQDCSGEFWQDDLTVFREDDSKTVDVRLVIDSL